MKVLLVNKKARFNYILEDTLECGVVLKGTEVKALREKKAAFNDAFVTITKKNEIFLEKFHISPYKFGNINNHTPEAKRKLLAHKKEIMKLNRKIKEKGFTLVPTRIYFKQSLIKVEIALAKGKKLHDKRESLKQKDQARDLARTLKKHNY